MGTIEKIVYAAPADQAGVAFLKGGKILKEIRPVEVIGEGLAQRRRPEGTGEKGKEEIPMKK